MKIPMTQAPVSSNPGDSLDFHEVVNPSFNDMTLADQILHGVNDWVAEDRDGKQFFGRTCSEAIRAAKRYHGAAWIEVACSPEKPVDPRNMSFIERWRHDVRTA